MRRRPSLTGNRPALLLLACWLGSVPASGAELLTSSGKWVRGPASASSRKLTVAGVTVPTDRVIALRLGNGAAVDTVDQALVLTNADVLAGTVQSLQAGRISFVSDSLGPIRIQTGAVSAVALQPHALVDLAAVTGGQAGAVLVNGDFAAGKIEWINSETVGVNNGRRIMKVPRERIALVRLQSDPAGPGATGRTGGARQRVRLAGGDRLSGRLVSLTADVLELETAFAGRVKLPVSAVHELWSEGGPIVPLTTLRPAEVKQVPQFDEVFPHLLDRSQGGGFLSVGGRRYERGLGCHSRCELAYDLAGTYAAFVAEIGMDDEVGRRGAVVFQVLVDGKVAFTSGIVRGGDPPRTICVPLARAKRLRLVVDFGPGGASAGDHADWGRAILVRK